MADQPTTPTCSNCGRETFTQHTPEEGVRGPFHIDTLSLAGNKCTRVRVGAPLHADIVDAVTRGDGGCDDTDDLDAVLSAVADELQDAAWEVGRLRQCIEDGEDVVTFTELGISIAYEVGRLQWAAKALAARENEEANHG